MYTILDPNLMPVGSLTIRSDSKGTKFWGDTITQQIADDGSNDDPTANLSMTVNKLDSQANHKLWNHTLDISFDNDTMGSKVVSGYYLTYYDSVMKHYYLMMLTSVEQSPEQRTRTATGVNSAIYDMAGIYPEAKSFTQASLFEILSYIFKYVPWSLQIVPNDVEIDYNIDGNQTAQALIQDLQVKFNVEIDAYVELDNSGRISNRVVWVGKLGTNRGSLIRSGSQTKGYESMTAKSVSDSFYTKFYISGVTDDNDPEAGSIMSVNAGLNYIVDDKANRLYNPVGASEGTYREVKLNNTVLKTPTALLDWAKEQVQLLNHPRYNYTVTALHDMVVGLGDTVAIQDKKAIPEINITSRVIQRQISFSSPENNLITFGEFGSSNVINNQSSDIINVIKKDVTVVQEATQNAINQAKVAHDEAVKAQEQAIHAQTSADGKVMSLTVDSVGDLPVVANEGDIAWVTLEDGTHGYTFINGQWIEDINPNLKKSIQDGVTTAISTAKADTEKAISDNNASINKTIDQVSQEKIDLAIKDADFNAQAQAMADKALSDAKANTATVAQDTLNSANQNIAQAKSAITDAYKTADGAVNKRIDDTASGINSTITQNKIDANGKIATAQSTATQALNEVSTKVSQTDYNAKTSDLDTRVTKAQTTADGAVTTVGNYQTSNDKRVKATETSIAQNAKDITLRATTADLNSAKSDYNAQIAQVKVDAGKVETTVSNLSDTVNNISIGGRNYVLNSSAMGATGGSDRPSLQPNGVGTAQSGATIFYGDDSIALSHTGNGTQEWYYALAEAYQTYASSNLDKTKQYTLSVDVKGTAPYAAFRVNDVFSPSVAINSDTWTSLTYTFNFPMLKSPNADNYYIRLNATGGNFTKGQTLSFRNFKMEEGNKATDWTPAPEDISNALASQQVTINGITDTVSNPKTGLSVRVQTAEGTLSKVQGTDIPALQNATFWQPYSSLNFNDYTQQGSFFFNTTAGKPNGPITPGQPGSGAWVYLMVEQGRPGNTTGDTRVKQTAWYDGAGIKTTYVRTLNSGTWSPWYANDNDSVTTIAQTNSDVKQEISDRKTGDSNTLQSSKDFTTSSITGYDTGLQTQLVQTNSGILATVSANNLVVDSSLMDSAISNSIVNWDLSGANRFYYSSGVAYQGVQSIGYNETAQGSNYSYLHSQTWSSYSFAGSTLNVSVDIRAPKMGGTSTDNLAVNLIECDANMKVLVTTNIATVTSTNSSWVNYRKKITVGSSSKNFYLSYAMQGNGNVYIARPYVGVQELVTGGYTAGANNNNQTILSLFKDNWSIGINDNIGGIVSGIVGNASQMSLISKKVVITHLIRRLLVRLGLTQLILLMEPLVQLR